MSNVLNIRFFGKGDGGVGTVFMNGGLRYRITTVIEGKEFAKQMRGFYSDLSKGRSKREFVYRIVCPRGRHRFLEIVREHGAAVLHVYELVKGVMKSCFCWKGNDAEFLEAFRRLDLLLFLSRLG